MNPGECVNKKIEWFKQNKLTGFLVLVVVYLLYTLVSSNTSNTVYRSKSVISDDYEEAAYDLGTTQSVGIATEARAIPPAGGAAPQIDVTDRKVVTKSSMSLQVKNVREGIDKIKEHVELAGGYMVDSNINTPEIGESGSIAVRIPSEKLDDALKTFRELAVKVVSENISGNDITDEYIDIEERITRLEETKTRFEKIMDEAVKIEDILRVQREIINLQDQIDSYKGRLNYMDGASSTTLIRVYLATDELGLPYTPANPWRPQVVFKQATRALLTDLIWLGNAVIWVAVYSPLILLIWFIYKLIKKTAKRQ